MADGHRRRRVGCTVSAGTPTAAARTPPTPRSRRSRCCRRCRRALAKRPPCGSAPRSGKRCALLRRWHPPSPSRLSPKHASVGTDPGGVASRPVEAEPRPPVVHHEPVRVDGADATDMTIELPSIIAHFGNACIVAFLMSDRRAAPPRPECDPQSNGCTGCRCSVASSRIGSGRWSPSRKTSLAAPTKSRNSGCGRVGRHRRVIKSIPPPPPDAAG